MKTDFTVNVRVTLDATDRVAALIERLLSGAGSEQAAQPVQQSSLPEKKSDKPAKTVTEPAPEAPAEPETKTEPEAPAKPEMSPEERKQRIRRIMDCARVRIEGSDYKENTTGELYRKYHSKMSQTFLQIAVAFGADRPTELPEARIEDFARACDEIKLDDTGEITINTPF